MEAGSRSRPGSWWKSSCRVSRLSLKVRNLRLVLMMRKDSQKEMYGSEGLIYGIWTSGQARILFLNYLWSELKLLLQSRLLLCFPATERRETRTAPNPWSFWIQSVVNSGTLSDSRLEDSSLSGSAFVLLIQGIDIQSMLPKQDQSFQIGDEICENRG